MDKYKIIKMHRHLYQYFEGQDYENHYFDVTFFVEGKKLYAHSATLAYHSSVFEELFMKNRSTPDEPYQIYGYSYDEFYEFLRLFYLPAPYWDVDVEVDFDNTHIIALYKLADFYAAEHIKELCDTFGDIYDKEGGDVFEFIALAHKHSWPYHKTPYDKWDNRFYDLIQNDDFVNLDKSVFTAFVAYAFYHEIIEEDIYKAVYKWGEYRAMITVEMAIEEKKELVLYYIKDFLPLLELDFKNVSNEFVFEFAVPKGFISIEEANKYATIKVTVISEGKSISASFVDNYGIFELIKSHEKEKFSNRGAKRFCIWGRRFKRPSTPSNVEKMKGCDWYLLIDRDDAKLYVKHRKMVEKNDYLIAEMKYENENESGDFVLVDNKITATASRIYTD